MRAAWCVYPLMFWAIALHNGLAAFALGELPLERFIQPSGSDAYGSGTLLTYVPRLLHASGPVVTALAIMGGRRLLHRRDGLLLLLAPLAYFAAETLLYAFGSYSSGGYARFLVPLTPWLAVLASAAAEPLFLRRRPDVQWRTITACGVMLIALWMVCEIEWWWRPPKIPTRWVHWVIAGRIAAAAFALLLAVVLYRLARRPDPHGRSFARRFVTVALLVMLSAPAGAALRPLRLLPQHRLIRDAAPSLDPPSRKDHPLVAANYWVYYWTDRWVDQPGWWPVYDQAAPATWFVWDARFCPEPHPDISRERMAANADWRLLWESPPDAGADVPFLALFERVAAPRTIPASAPG